MVSAAQARGSWSAGTAKEATSRSPTSRWTASPSRATVTAGSMEASPRMPSSANTSTDTGSIYFSAMLPKPTAKVSVAAWTGNPASVSGGGAVAHAATASNASIDRNARIRPWVVMFRQPGSWTFSVFNLAVNPWKVN